MKRLGEKGEIAALVREPPLAEEGLIFFKEQGKVLELPAQRAARLEGALFEQFFVDAGGGELCERLVYGARRPPLEVGELALLL